MLSRVLRVCSCAFLYQPSPNRRLRTAHWVLTRQMCWFAAAIFCKLLKRAKRTVFEQGNALGQGLYPAVALLVHSLPIGADNR